jgi:hypothetical protein
MAHIRLGEGTSIDLNVLLRTRMLVAASSGGGKSWTIRRILEQSHGHVQQIVLDYEGEFSTLREKFDYVLVGKGGEVAADVRYAAQLAKRLLELGVSAIIDLYELSASQRKAFVRVFLEALINLPKELWHPCLVVVDEAHVFCCEKGKGESEATLAVIDLATRGRKRGYCAVLATQDIAKLNKDASGECRNRLVGLAVEDKTRKRSGEELGLVEKSEILGLRNLKPGEFYAFGPAIANEVKKVTIGSVQTSHPDYGMSMKSGKRRAMAPPPPREKVKAILAKLADLPKEAEDEANKLYSLAQENTRLKRILHERQSEATKVVKETVKVPVLDTKALADFEMTVMKALKTLQTTSKPGLRKEVTIAKERILSGTPWERPSLPPWKLPLVETGPGTKNGIGGPQRKILSVLAQYPQGRTLIQIALLTGYAKDGGAFRNPLGALRTLGYLEGKDILRITNVGLKMLGSYDPLPEPGPTLLDHWMSKVSGPEREILRVLMEAWPNELAPEEIASRTRNSNGQPYAPDGGAFRNPLGRLRTLELIEGNRSGIRLSADLMGS